MLAIVIVFDLTRSEIQFEAIISKTNAVFTHSCTQPLIFYNSMKIYNQKNLTKYIFVSCPYIRRVTLFHKVAEKLDRFADLCWSYQCGFLKLMQFQKYATSNTLVFCPVLEQHFQFYWRPWLLLLVLVPLLRITDYCECATTRNKVERSHSFLLRLQTMKLLRVTQQNFLQVVVYCTVPNCQSYSESKVKKN